MAPKKGMTLGILLGGKEPSGGGENFEAAARQAFQALKDDDEESFISALREACVSCEEEEPVSEAEREAGEREPAESEGY